MFTPLDYRSTNKKLTFLTYFLAFNLLLGCDKADDSKNHLQKGVEYLNKGELEKAKLEIKSSSQAGKETAETYYYMALLDEKNQHFRGMKENLLKTVELAPDYSDARIRLGKVQVLFGETDNAMIQAETILKKSGQNLEALVLKASVLIKQKKPTEALAIIDHILKDNPHNTEALSLKAMIYMEKENYSQALALIEEAKKSDPNNIGLDFFKIQLDAKTKNIDAVMADYENLVTSHPENREFKVTLAKLYVQVGKAKEAENVLFTLIESEPNNVQTKTLVLDFLSATSVDRVDQQFQKFTDFHKAQPRALLELANWMIARRNFEAAKPALNQVIELEEDSSVGLSAKILLAKMEFENKHFDAVSKIVAEVLDANPNYDDAKILEARLFLVKEDYDAAIALLNRVIWSKEGSEEANLLLAQIFLIKSDLKKADQHFSSVLETNPANLQALNYLYDKALSANDIKSAKNIIEKALAIRPNNIVFLEKLANINLSERDWESAKMTAQKIANSPDPLANSVASYLLAKVLQGQGSYQQAIDIYKTLLKVFPENSDALGNMARCYEKLNKRSEMISYLNDLLAVNPQNIPAGILQVDLLLLNKEYDKGELLLTTLIKSHTKVPQLYTSLASIYLEKKEFKRAISVFQEGLNHNPDDIKLALSLADLYEQQGSFEAAVEIYEALLKTNPDLDIATNNLASVLNEHYVNEVDLKKAAHLAEKFKYSSQPYYKDTYAWSLIKTGNINEGLKVLTEIVTVSPKIPVFRYHLGVAYYMNGNNSLAMNEINQAIELDNKVGFFPDRKNAENLLNAIIHKIKGS